MQASKSLFFLIRCSDFLHLRYWKWNKFLVFFIILCSSLLSGLPAESQTWCQKSAFSRNGFTISFQPGTFFSCDDCGLGALGTGRASAAASSTHDNRLQINSSAFSQCSMMLHLICYPKSSSQSCSSIISANSSGLTLLRHHFPHISKITFLNLIMQKNSLQDLQGVTPPYPQLCG